MSSSRDQEIVDYLKARIPAELFEQGFVGNIKPPEADGSNDFFILGIKNSAILNALIQGLSLGQYTSLDKGLIKKDSDTTQYSIRLGGAHANKLHENLLALEPEKTKKNLAALVVSELHARDKETPKTLSKIINQYQLKSLRTPLEKIKNTPAPKTLAEALVYTQAMEKLTADYEQLKALNKKNVPDEKKEQESQQSTIKPKT